MTLFFNDTATTEIYTLSLHDALPIWPAALHPRSRGAVPPAGRRRVRRRTCRGPDAEPLRALQRRGADRRDGGARRARLEEHTSELQSRQYLVCRLLLEKKNPLQGLPRDT